MFQKEEFCKRLISVLVVLIMLMGVVFVGCSQKKTEEKPPETQDLISVPNAILENKTPVLDNPDESCYTSESIIQLKAEDIVSITVDDHYGENETDAKMIRFTKENDHFYKTTADYGVMKNDKQEVTEEQYKDAIGEASKLTTIRTYDDAPSVIWSYATVETIDGERYFFNDQSEIKKLSAYLWGI